MREMINNVEYRIGRENKIVICKLWGCEYLAIDKINKHGKISIDKEEDYLINSVYVGVSWCSPFRKFNEEKGKKLALERALFNRDQAVKNAINLYIKNTEKNLEYLAELVG